MPENVPEAAFLALACMEKPPNRRTPACDLRTDEGPERWRQKPVDKQLTDAAVEPRPYANTEMNVRRGHPLRRANEGESPRNYPAQTRAITLDS